MITKCFECGADTEHGPQEKGPKCGACGHPFGILKPGTFSFSYAHKDTGKWDDMADSRMACYGHDFDRNNPIYEIRVQASETGGYWAWWEHKYQRFVMIQPHIKAARICFTYGPEAEEERGRGKLCQVSLEADGPGYAYKDKKDG